MGLVKVFFWGMMVSFLGSLPLGTLNVAAMQISVQESITNAIYFSLGSLLVEMIYVRISLVGINWIRKQKKIIPLDGMDYARDCCCAGSRKFYCCCATASCKKCDAQ